MGDADSQNSCKMQRACGKGTGISLLGRKGNIPKDFLQASQSGFVVDTSGWWGWEDDKKGDIRNDGD